MRQAAGSVKSTSKCDSDPLVTGFVRANKASEHWEKWERV